MPPRETAENNEMVNTGSLLGTEKEILSPY